MNILSLTWLLATGGQPDELEKFALQFVTHPSLLFTDTAEPSASHIYTLASEKQCRLNFNLVCKHSPISTATTHIGSSYACIGGQRRFGLILINVSANKKQFLSVTPNQSYHCFALSSL